MNIKQMLFFNAILCTLFSAAMAFTMVVINVGFVSGFFGIWLKSFGVGVCVSLPVAFIVVPPLQKLTKKWIK
ncbi:MAG: DUF2798 domain-containing protein [Clostridiales Family XIII bacterium]|nr:DUF2798 domain-containing protein [Clostridiales Family XIII bacterium]